MTIPFFGAVGDLFERLGSYGSLLSEVRTYQLAQLVNTIDPVTGVVAQLDLEPDIQAIMGGSYIGLINGAGQAVGSTAQTLAGITVSRMVYRDNPRFNQTLTQQNVFLSMVEIIRQMKSQGATVLQMTVSATPSVGPSGGSFAGIGTGVVVASVNRPQDGLYQENLFAENLLVTCATDSYSRTATAGNESLDITGVGQQTNLFAWDWPLGSNCSLSVTAIDGNQDNSGGNLLVNSGFEDWTGTGNFLNNWQLITGTLGVNIAEENSNVYDGTAAIVLTGDGATNVRWRQKFNDGTVGTSTLLDTYTQYAFNVFMRRDGIQAGAGSLQIALTDVNGNVLLDAGNNLQKLIVDLTGLTTNYMGYNVCFQTPPILPSDVYLDFELLVPITAGRQVFLDKAAMGLSQQCYSSGPYIAVFAGSVPFLIGDFATVLMANSRGVGSTISTWQTLWYRLFPDIVSRFELQLPSSTVPNILDSLIV